MTDISNSSSSSSTTTKNKNNNNKSLYETIFKSKEFVLDVYIRFDCLLYFILSFLGIYSPEGIKNVVNYHKFFKNSTYTLEESSSEDIYGISDSYDQQQQQQEYDIDGIRKFYENQIFLNFISMYSILLAVVTLIQSIIAFRILLSKDKSVKTSNIHLLLIIDFILIWFNAWVLVFRGHLFIPMGYVATLITLLISIGDFLFLFFLSSTNKSLIVSIKSTINSITTFSKSAKKAYKEELKKKKQDQLQQQKKKN